LCGKTAGKKHAEPGAGICPINPGAKASHRKKMPETFGDDQPGAGRDGADQGVSPPRGERAPLFSLLNARLGTSGIATETG